MSSPVWWGRPRPLRPEYRCVLHAFFDDSGKESQADHRFVCLAGYLGHDQHWWGFAQHWRHLLMRHGVREVHMKEWEATRRKNHWAKPYSNRILGEFIEAIKGAQLIGFGVAVDADAWRKLPQEHRRRFGDAQEFCFSRIMRCVIDRIDIAGEREPLEIVFDQDFEYSSRRLNILKHLYKQDPRLAARISSIAFSDSRAHSQLQAADILAWETRRHLVNRVGNTPQTDEWHDLFEPLMGHEMEYAAGEYWDANEISEKLDGMLAEWKAARASYSSSQSNEKVPTERGAP
jgi:hypothetical protein